jgi:type IV pilus assembly protein PilQ
MSLQKNLLPNRDLSRPKSRSHWMGALATMSCLIGLGAAGSVSAQGSNRLERIETIPLPGDKIELRLHMSEVAPQPIEFEVDNPARISLDLPDTSISLPARRVDVKRGGLDTVTAAEANGRTRVVLNLDSRLPHETRVSGNVISVVLGAGAKQASTAAAAPGAEQASTNSSPQRSVSGARSINNVDFRRGADGSGRVIVELSDARVPADLRQEGGRIVVTFAKTALPDAGMRRYDVVDFATPVSAVDVVRVGDSARLLISATGDWEQIAYQADNIYTIEIKPVVKLPPELQEKREYTGERLTLNFQDIEARAVLQLLADTSGQNMVISDTVRGNVTLRLQDVPWDQALDIVLRNKGLDMRKQGNVILVAPAAEMAARDKELLAARKETSELSPVRTEYLQVNYAKAADLAALIKSGKGNSLLSDRGNVSIDERTNTLLLQDITERLTDIRRLVSTLDIPVRQVQIEARVVIVSDDFSRELGVRWGYSNINQVGSNTYSVTGSAAGAEDSMRSVMEQNVAIARATATAAALTPPGVPNLSAIPAQRLQTGAGAYLVNLPAANPAGRIAMAVLGDSYLVDMELSAAQAEGRGEIISSPRVITANQKEATIEQGVEIPYQEGSSSGATTVTFKKAVLSLKVTPQITPDNRVILDLEVKKDSVGQLVPTGSLGGTIPSIDTREITTQVLVNDGETVVLGGILETEKRENESGIPYLANIPVLGHLFKTKTSIANKRELLIFITPKVLRETATIN